MRKLKNGWRWFDSALDRNITVSLKWLLLYGFCLVPGYEQIWVRSLGMHPSLALIAANGSFLLGLWIAHDKAKARDARKRKRKQKPSKEER
jgi:hypothetical protein